MNTHIQKKPENITLLLSSIFSVVSFLCIFLYSSTAIPIISVIRKKRSMLYFKNTRFRYREDQHGPCARMTRKFVKRSIIFFCLETNKQKKPQGSKETQCGTEETAQERPACSPRLYHSFLGPSKSADFSRPRFLSQESKDGAVGVVKFRDSKTKDRHPRGILERPFQQRLRKAHMVHKIRGNQFY